MATSLSANDYIYGIPYPVVVTGDKPWEQDGQPVPGVRHLPDGRIAVPFVVGEPMEDVTGWTVYQVFPDGTAIGLGSPRGGGQGIQGQSGVTLSDKELMAVPMLDPAPANVEQFKQIWFGPISSDKGSPWWQGALAAAGVIAGGIPWGDTFNSVSAGLGSIAPLTAQEITQAGTNLVASGAMTAGDALAVVNEQLAIQGLGTAALDVSGQIVAAAPLTVANDGLLAGLNLGDANFLGGTGLDPNSLVAGPGASTSASGLGGLENASPFGSQFNPLTGNADDLLHMAPSLGAPVSNPLLGSSLLPSLTSDVASTGSVISQLMSSLGITSSLAQSIVGSLGVAGALALISGSTGKTQQSNATNVLDQKGLAQFPVLNAQTASTQAAAIQNLGTTLGTQINTPTSFDLPGGVSPAKSFANTITNAQNRVNNPTPYPTLDAMGLFPGQRSGFDEAVKQSSSLFSGNLAARGFLSPENVGAIAGSAAQHVMPTFAPLIGTNLNNQATFTQNTGAQNQADLLAASAGGFNASLSPENVRVVRNKQLQDYINGLTGALGGQNVTAATGNTLFPSFGQSLGTAAASGAANTLIGAPGRSAT